MPIYFQLNQQQLPFTLESVGHNWYQVYINRPEGYPYYHWLQTESGIGEVWIQQKKIRLTCGEGILIAPFIPHIYFSIDNWQTKFATFNGEFSPYFSEITQVPTFAIASDTSNFNFSNWIDELIHEHLANRLIETNLSTKCYDFLLQFRHLQQHNKEQQHPLFQQFVFPTLIEIETNYASQLTSQQLAQKLFITPQYLSRLFKRFLNQSPYQYLTDYRMNRAKELLINDLYLDIQDIALRVGFMSTSQFIQLFKQRTSYTPNQFRQLFYSSSTKKG